MLQCSMQVSKLGYLATSVSYGRKKIYSFGPDQVFWFNRFESLAGFADPEPGP